MHPILAPKPSRNSLPDRWVWRIALILFVVGVVAFPRGARAQSDAGDIDLEALEKAFEKVVDRVSPSVVSLRVQRRYGLNTDAGFEQLIMVNGSGVVLSADGLILTNEHVIQSATTIDVIFHDGVTRAAELVASDPRADMAVLRVGRGNLQPVHFCEWTAVRRGQWTLALGNPFGLGRDGKVSVSVGVISNLGRRLPGLAEVDDRMYDDMIQTTAAINPGNSGGPLFNVRGELIGLVTAMHTRAAADEGAGFAIPLTPERRAVVERLRRGERPNYGYLGVIVREPDEAERLLNRAPAGEGVVIERIADDGPAKAADLRAGDVIIRLNDTIVRSPGQFSGLLSGVGEGRMVSVKLLRDGKELALNVQPVEREVSQVNWMRGGAMIWRGLRVTDLTPQSRSKMRVEAGATGVVVIDVVENTPAARSRLKIGDVVDAVNGRAVDSIVAFRDAVRGAGRMRLNVRDRGEIVIQP
ncbi:MAG: trypsin-like peptidase domain-containing protein [Phycisphaerales bacterium]|nr:trypsin-like peptidase domain-containing protein [Phycisphaerales bacterium]